MLLIIIFEIRGRRGARAINQRLITWRAERESNLFRNKHDGKKRTRYDMLNYQQCRLFLGRFLLVRL